MKARMAGVHVSVSGKEISRRDHTQRRLVEGRVCINCNCGWMARLEAESAPLLRTWAKRRGFRNPSKSDRITVARWALKTATVLSTASNYPTLVPAKHRLALVEEGNLPHGIAVFCGWGPGDPGMLWMQGLPWQVETKRSLRRLRGVAAKAYLTALNLPGLFLGVGWWPEESFCYVLRLGIHHPIWMGKGPYAMRNGPNLEKVKDLNDKLQFLEGEADKLMLVLYKDLYSNRSDPIQVMVLKDLYELLEKIIDRCRDAGNVISHIVLKNS